MLEKALRWLQKRVTWRVALLLFGVQTVATMIVSAGWAPQLRAVGDHLLIDMMFAYSADDLYRALGAYGEDGRAAYAAYLTQIDFLYGTLSGLAFAAVLLAVSRSLRRLSGLFLVLALLPMLMTLFDYAEDLTLLAIVGRFPEVVIPLASLASLLTSVKLILVYASIASMIVGIGLVLTQELAKAKVKRQKVGGS